MPGSIHSRSRRDAMHLIKQGAMLVEEADEILEELRWPCAMRTSAERIPTSPCASSNAWVLRPLPPTRSRSAPESPPHSVAAQLLAPRDRRANRIAARRLFQRLRALAPRSRRPAL
jgi:predicted Rossmann fold nucleotide-binding protein DprA/Smf involved in DNA uptake